MIARLELATDDDPWVGLCTVERLEAEALQIAADPGIRAVQLVGGARHFCSGAAPDVLLGPDPARALRPLMRRLPMLLLDLPVPVVAVVRGHAVGGGWMVALWCDAFFLAEESLYGANFTSLGLTPGMGATQRLPELFGEPLAGELMFGGALHKGRELLARQPSLTGSIVARSAIDGSVSRWCASVSEADPFAVRTLKAHRSERSRRQLLGALEAEEAMQQACAAQSTFKARVATMHAGLRWST